MIAICPRASLHIYSLPAVHWKLVFVWFRPRKKNIETLLAFWEGRRGTEPPSFAPKEAWSIRTTHHARTLYCNESSMLYCGEERRVPNVHTPFICNTQCFSLLVLCSFLSTRGTSQSATRFLGGVGTHALVAINMEASRAASCIALVVFC